MDPTLMNSVRLPRMDTNKELNLLKEAVYKFFVFDFKNFRYEELYRAGYYLVVSQHAKELYSELGTWMSESIQILASQIRPAEESLAFLNSIEKLWSTANAAISITCGVLIYLTDHYLVQNNLVGIRNLGYKYFYDYLLKREGNMKRLSAAILSEIDKDINGELIDRSVIRKLSEMLRKISEVNDEKIYYNCLEAPYIAHLTEFCKITCGKLLSENSIPNFLLEVEKIIKREIMRAEEFLAPSSQEKVFACLKTILLESNVGRLLVNDNSWLEMLIQQGRLEDLGRVYNLFFYKTSLKLSKPFVDALRAVLNSFGAKYVNQALAEHAWLKIIDLILELTEKYNTIWNDQFMKDKDIQVVIHESLTNIINSNDSVYKGLASYYNNLLIRGALQISETERDQRIEEVMSVFKRVRSKDKFAQYYIQLMAKRLLGKTLRSDDTERTVIAKFKAECGVYYTQKMEAMMKDIVISNEECNRFLDQQNQPYQFDILILSHGLWPFENWSANYMLPIELEGIRERFELFYLKNHKGRKLEWKMNKSTIEFTGYFSDANQKYCFIGNVIEVLILLQFNETETISVAKIQAKFKLPKERIESSITVLINAKLLLKLEMTNEFTLNEHYKNKYFKVRIPSSEKQQANQEKIENELSVELRREREQKIDATLVKIMKARRKENHNILITDTIKMLSSFFPPDATLIKSRIEYLIEAEYIKRSPNDHKSYIYIA